MLFETELTKLFYDLKTGYSIPSEGLSSLQDYILDMRALLEVHFLSESAIIVAGIRTDRKSGYHENLS